MPIEVSIEVCIGIVGTLAVAINLNYFEIIFIKELT